MLNNCPLHQVRVYNEDLARGSKSLKGVGAGKGPPATTTLEGSSTERTGERKTVPEPNNQSDQEAGTGDGSGGRESGLQRNSSLLPRALARTISAIGDVFMHKEQASAFAFITSITSIWHSIRSSIILNLDPYQMEMDSTLTLSYL